MIELDVSCSGANYMKKLVDEFDRLNRFLMQLKTCVVRSDQRNCDIIWTC